MKDLRGAPRVPDWRDFQDRAVQIAHGLFDKLEAALAAEATLSELEAIRREIEDLGNQVRVAGLIMGLMVPFNPKPKKSGLIAFGPWLSFRGIRTLFPWMDAAIDFLTGKQIVPASEFRSLSIDEQQKAFTAPGMEDRDELKKLRDEIAKGQNQEEGGESFAQFRKRIADQVSLTRAQTETVFRTNVKQGLVSGFEKSMKSDLVSEIFPAVMFSATPDNRVRDTHWDLDGFVCLKTDPAYKVLLRAIKDWNCILPGGSVTGDFLCGVKSRYEGKAVEIETLDGTVIRVTKNHPILTANGFIAAGKLNGSEQLFFNVGGIEECGDNLSAASFSRCAAQKYDMPATVQDVFGSLESLGFQECLRPVANNFHGEAACFDGNVSVVWSDRKLLGGFESSLAQHGKDLIFKPSDSGTMGVRHNSGAGRFVHSGPFEGFGFGLIPRGDSGLLQNVTYGAAADVEILAKLIDRQSAFEAFDDCRGVGFSSRPDGNSLFGKPSADCRKSDGKMLRQFRAAHLAGAVKISRIRSIRHFDYSGETFDFQTTTGFILLNGLAIGNCRCSLIPLTMEDAKDQTGGIRTIGDLKAFYPEVMAKYGTGL